MSDVTLWIVVVVSGSKGGDERFYYGPYRNEEKAKQMALRAFDSGEDCESADAIPLLSRGTLTYACQLGEKMKADFLAEMER